MSDSRGANKGSNPTDKLRLSASCSHAALADGAIIVAILAAWVLFVSHATGGRPSLFYDSFRDTAYAENILAGRLWQDPCINGLPFWYAPGNPLLFAGLAAVSGRSVVDLYASSSFWLNGLQLVLLYLLVRGVWGRAAGVVAVPMLWLGSYWWLLCGAAPMPSIQGVWLNLLGLMCWHRCRAGAWYWPVLSGVVLAASIWHHPLCGVVLGGAMVLHTLFWLATRPAGAQGLAASRLALVRPMLVAGGVGAVLSGPLLVHLLRLPQRNLDPFLHVANELTDLRFALEAHAPLSLVLGVAGAVWVLRRMPAAAWVVAYLVVGLVGQLAGYLGHFAGLPIPYLLPHEFQWHGQLALAICGAVAVVALARWSDRRATHTGRLWLPFGRAVFFVCVLTLGPALRWLPRAGDYFIDVNQKLAGNRDWLAWIRTHTPIEATFICDVQTAHFLVCGITGRKAIAVPPGHLNPAADAAARFADLRTLLSTRDESTFRALARRYGADYLLATPAAAEPPGMAETYAGWSCLRREYVSAAGDTIIYRVQSP